MNRVYHHYERWEDWKLGFYDNCSGAEKKEKIQKVVEMFESEELTTEYMNRVIEEWKYSCEHNLTNESINKIAYIGQAACCIYAKIPNSVTMEAWSLLSKDVQQRSDNIAKRVIEKWKQNNRLIQLCLNLD
jgi:hypothetical protein